MLNILGATPVVHQKKKGKCFEWSVLVLDEEMLTILFSCLFDAKFTVTEFSGGTTIGEHIFGEPEKALIQDNLEWNLRRCITL